MNAQVARGSDQFMLRLPDGMRERIKAAAEKNGRSMNAEIVHTLELIYSEKFETDKHLSDFDIDPALNKLTLADLGEELMKLTLRYIKKND